MYLPFDEIDFEARVWIYQANRSLTHDEVSTLTETLIAALDGWEAHGLALTASGKIFLNRFVVIAVDEAKELPSGCSIDKSTRWMQEIGGQWGIDFFDRSLAYLDDDNNLQTVPVSQIKAAISAGDILPDSIVFDNTVATKAQWMKRWKAQAQNTWLKKYFAALNV
ncbi:hypothetical protein [Runella zeae]|jgi:hypothetical protein|uniref:hypothetical protein n=1 Tax=Runella zeae TaxID=94255 RepID=UPI0023572268|nr:hypothetical protein [Runella zeae]